ncbi:DUF6230 family protein [Streptomyces sp. WI04-05B]|uniref:DUF6230 family protein n=1 Tax=Streptomyces TaxID=1883 RepID=UPI0029A7662A|nr:MULTISPECIES: DUF6230 family protein [unclassified Streptomyces]MDX2547038.1 DUF6230 family protein [Streptomyces sp. WI04-05B]MDX2589727.1 DUF6230 family protein [Streptomyces sp. WI04-05A]MDX3753177.1 DUF6230 family protein [Streptomyces sp. AK08-02]
MESQVRGGTRWKRFAVVMVPSVAATACIGVALAQGALAASFSVSGQSFKVRADYIEGTGFSQYGAVDMDDSKTDKGTHPVAVSAFSDARIQNMCQSVVTPKIPFFGTATLVLSAGDSSDKDKQVSAKNLYIDVERLEAGKAVFSGMNIGVAAKSLDNPPMKGGKELSDPNGFGQDADHVDLYDVKQTAWATTAGTFTLPGLSMKVLTGTHECY